MARGVIVYQTVIDDIREIIRQGREKAYQAISAAQVMTYWNVGKRIVEQEQRGSERAEYGKRLLETLASRLTGEFGDGYSKRNLQYYRRFFLLFPDEEIVNARVHNLNWTHFRSLLRVEDERMIFDTKPNKHAWIGSG